MEQRLAAQGAVHEVEAELREATGATPHLDFSYDPALRTLWITMDPSPRPCFTPELVDSVLRVGDAVRRIHCRVYPSRDQPIKFAVFGSRAPGVFCLGGDLEVFVEAIETGRRDVVERYGRNGARAVHHFIDGFGSSIVTVALVQGIAMGGGFESACCCDVVVAEEHSTFQLPEMKFNMFPGLGVVSVMSRRMGPRLVRDMVFNGTRIAASEALQRDAIDHVAPSGEGRAFVEALVAKALPAHAAYLGIYKGLRESDGATLDRMLLEADRWAAAANALDPQDVDVMKTLLALQRRKFPMLVTGD